MYDILPGAHFTEFRFVLTAENKEGKRAAREHLIEDVPDGMT